MSVLGKLKFWHKGDDLGLGDDLAIPKGNLPTDDLGLQSPGLPPRQSGQPEMQQPEPRIESFEGARQYAPQPQPQSSYGSNRDLELVSAKLDAIKASLDSINQRLANLERAAYGEEEQRRAW